jgi:hypothetical protein
LLKISNKNNKSIIFRESNINKDMNVCFFILNNKIDFLNGNYYNLSNFDNIYSNLYFKVNNYAYFFGFNDFFRFVDKFLKQVNVEFTDFAEITVLNNFIMNLNFSNTKLYYKLFNIDSFNILVFSFVSFLAEFIIYLILVMLLNIVNLLLNIKK